MSDWKDGYVGGIDYTYGYYQHINPERIKLAFLKAELAYPEIRTACELGFGQGIGINLLAAAGGVEWYGTDFSPSHASFARELGSAMQDRLHLRDEAFADFCAREELPEFDYIALHGIWSWISDDNRRVIVDFVRRKLKAGGVLYISYNTLPAAAAFVPLRNLMLEHTKYLGAQGDPIATRIGRSLEFAKALIEADPLYGAANPMMAKRIEKMATQDPEYLAHEYFNEHWQPMDFVAMTRWLEPARLEFACSASYHDNLDVLSATAPQREFLATIPAGMLREAARDLLVNQQFRRDYWVKGKRKINAWHLTEAFKSSRVVLTRPAQDIVYKVRSGTVEADLNESIYRPVVEAMSDNAVHDIAGLAEKLAQREITLAQLFEVVLVLIGAEYAAPARAVEQVERARPVAHRLNADIMQRARGGAEINYLASPVLGGGVGCGRFRQLFLLARAEGLETPEEWANHAWKLLQSQGQTIRHEGKTLETPAENLAFLRSSAEKFAEAQLPLLLLLQVI